MSKSSQSAENRLVLVAKIGRTVGVKGFVRLVNLSDFPQQFKNGARFFDEHYQIYKIKAKEGENVLFEGFESVEAAKTLTNLRLYQSVENSRKSCKLGVGEYFYFDIIGLKVLENGRLLGIVSDILNAGNDLLLIKSDEKLISQGFAAEFYLPYVDFYVREISLEKGEIYAQNAVNLLESLKN